MNNNLYLYLKKTAAEITSLTDRPQQLSNALSFACPDAAKKLNEAIEAMNEAAMFIDDEIQDAPQEKALLAEAINGVNMPIDLRGMFPVNEAQK